VARIAVVQRDLNARLSREMRTIRETGSLSAVLAVSAIAFAYGVVHAAGPGHGKLVASSYFLAREARPSRGLVVGTAISLLQVLSSVGLVLLLALALGYAGLDILDRSVWAEVVSYGLIVVVGLAMTIGTLTGHGHHEHGAAARPGRAGAGLVLAAGLTPCASAIILMLFALAHGVLVVGLAASLVMAVGMAMTVSAVGVATILARRAVLVPLRRRPRAAGWVARGLSATGGALIAAVGALFLAGAWSRLP
jgi:ABC-type nickel/cobalt efflux system permease component RcnA